MSTNVVISNPDRINKLKKLIKNQGKECLQVITDFDRTLTKFSVKGKRSPSLIGVLREQKYLTADYPKKAQALADKYHPIEIDPLISREDKTVAMEKWWRQHFELLIKSNLNKRDVWRAMRSSGIELRKGVREFLDRLEQNNIPLIIMSATGLGAESIEFFLKEIDCLKNNIHIISNSFVWDESGKAISVQQPIIHTFNKNGNFLHDHPRFKEIKNRKNIILLGDNLGDATMAQGFNYHNILKIAFLNNPKESLTDFKQSYDIIIIQDGSFDYVNSILEEIL